MEIILSNDFTNDPYLRRAVRLQEIQANIDELQPELALEPELLIWCQSEHTNFMDKWVAGDMKWVKKRGLFSNSP